MTVTQNRPGVATVSPAKSAPDESTYTGRFGVRLRELRLKAGLTVEELAEAIEKNNDSDAKSPLARAIYQWEQGKSAPRFDLFPAIARSLKLDSVALLLPED